MTKLPDIIYQIQDALGDRYSIRHELGKGGMATVYLAKDLRHQRLVALKVMRPDVASSVGTERFLHEIRVTAQLRLPRILPVFDSGEAAGQLWYTMPYVEGETLRQRLWLRIDPNFTGLRDNPEVAKLSSLESPPDTRTAPQ
jgi:serine/threonine-protein kinase